MRRLATAVFLAIAPAAMAAAPVQDSRQRALNHYRAGQELMISEKWDEAASEFQEATRLDPLFAMAFHDLGLCRMNLKAYPAALKAFTSSRDAFQQLYQLESTDKTKAEQRTDQELTEMRDSLNLARNSKYTNAFTVLKIEDRIRFLEENKRRGSTGVFEVPAEVSLGLGSAYLRMNQLDDAEREYLAALKVRPKFGEVHNNLAVVYLKKGQIKEAESSVKSAEKAGFVVPPGLKDAIKTAKK